MISFPLPQYITYWIPSGIDGNGDPTWAAGVRVAARWVKKDGIVMGDDGNQQKTKFMVYAETLVPKRALIALGDYNGQAEPTADALVVQGTVDNPSYTTLKKMML